MIDGVPKGDGTSRKITCADGNIPATWDDFRAALISSGILFDLSFNDDGWAEKGTILNKANILTDAAAARFGLTDTATTPNDVFMVIPTTSSSDAVWGHITGTLSDQTDLNTALAGKASKIEGELTLSISGWVGDTAPFTQEITVDGILETDLAIIAMKPSGTSSTDISSKSEFVKIDMVDSEADGFKFTCYTDKPTLSLDVQYLVVR